MRTRDKIIQASIELFNQHGERQITTNHIAAHLGISPGNLYYHFRNKNDIIVNIFAEYTQLLDHSFKPPSDEEDVLANFANYFDSIFELMWRFNFLYANLPDILARSEDLQKKYSDVHEHLIDKIINLVTWLKQNDIVEIDDEDIPGFANALKLTVTFWVSYLKVQAPNVTINKSKAYEGVLMILLQFKPYINAAALGEIKRLKEHYEALVEKYKDQEV